MDEQFNEDAAVLAWLAAAFRRSHSESTVRFYRTVMLRFRTFLTSEGLSLDPWRDLAEDAPDKEKRRVIGQFALKIRAWAERPAGKKPISGKAFNDYLAVISSFYQFCNRYDILLCGNPTERIERAKRVPYQGSRALEIEEVVKRLGAIDRSESKGCRDYALLAVLFETGRRINEVLSLQWKHLSKRGDGTVEVFFARTKGGGVKRDVLSQATSAALLSWIRMEYGEKTPKLNVWVWTSLAHRLRGQHCQLKYAGARDVMDMYLGTTRVHQARHTWARAMKLLGASLEERQQGLGHSAASTTQLYDAALNDAGNPRREQMAKLFGIT